MYSFHISYIEQLVVDSSLCSLGSTYAESVLSPNSTFNTSSVCSFLKRYLSNGPNTTQYDWRDSLRYTDELFSTIGEYIKVTFSYIEGA